MEKDGQLEFHTVVVDGDRSAPGEGLGFWALSAKASGVGEHSGSPYDLLCGGDRSCFGRCGEP
jgi:hypothetical protein